jgi:hypothetical protein
MHATFPINLILLFQLSYLVRSTNYEGDYTVFSNILCSVRDLDHLLSTPFTEILNLNSSFSLILIQQHHINSYVQGQLLHECVQGSGCLAPIILNFGTIIDGGEVCILYLDNF